jgi:hypothetical protein
MGKGMCEFMSSPKQIEHSNENKVIFIFLDYFSIHIIFSILTLHSLAFFFFFSPNSYCAYSNNFFYFCIFASKVILSKKFCSSKKQLYYVIANKILWEWMQEYHLFWHGTFVTLLLILLALLCLLVFWISLGVIGY